MKQSRKTMGHNWASSDQGPALPGLTSPAMPRFHLLLSFSLPASGLGLVLPLPPTVLTPEPTTGKGPSSCDTGLFQGGWAELGTTLLPSPVHLSAYPSPCPEPTLPSLAHTNVHAGKAPWQRGQKVASSVPNPLLDTLVFPFPPQKIPPPLCLGWVDHPSTLGVISPPMAPGSVSVLVPTCARVNSGWYQLSGSVADGFFHTCGRTTSRME